MAAAPVTEEEVVEPTETEAPVAEEKEEEEAPSEEVAA